MAKIHRWSLDESVGDFIDPIGADNGAPTAGVSRVTALFGGGILAQASSDLVDVGDPADLHFTSGDFTIRAMVNIQAITATGRILSRLGASGSRSYAMSVSDVAGGGAIYFWASGDGLIGAAQVTTGSLANYLGEWLDVVVTKSASIYRIYVNGVVVDENLTGVSVIFDAIGNTIMGNDLLAASGNTDMVIDQLEVWDVDLGPALIRNLYYRVSGLIMDAVSPATGAQGVLTTSGIGFSLVPFGLSTSIDLVNTIVTTNHPMAPVAYDNGFQAGWSGVITPSGGSQIFSDMKPDGAFYETFAYTFTVQSRDDLGNSLIDNSSFGTETIDGVANSGFEAPALGTEIAAGWSRQGLFSKGVKGATFGRLNSPANWPTPPEGDHVGALGDDVDTTIGSVVAKTQPLTSPVDVVLPRNGLDSYIVPGTVVLKDGTTTLATDNTVGQFDVDLTSVPVTSRLAAYFKLDDAAATTAVIDAAGKNLGAVLVGGKNTADVSAAGKLGTGLALSGSVDRVDIPYSPALAPENISIVAWVNVTSHANYASVLAKPYALSGWASPYQSYSLRSDDAGNGRATALFSVGGSFYFASSITYLVPGTWYLLVATYDGTDVRIYVNSVLEGTSPAGAGGPISYVANTDLSIATRSKYSVGESFNGVVDDVRLYPFALGQADIDAIYAAGSGAVATAPFTAPNDVGMAINHLSGGLIGYAIPTSLTVEYDVVHAGFSQALQAEHAHSDVVNYSQLRGSYRRAVPATPAIPAGASWRNQLEVEGEAVFTETLAAGDEGSVLEQVIGGSYAVTGKTVTVEFVKRYLSGFTDRCWLDSGDRGVEGFRYWGTWRQAITEQSDAKVAVDGGSADVDQFGAWGEQPAANNGATYVPISTAAYSPAVYNPRTGGAFNLSSIGLDSPNHDTTGARRLPPLGDYTTTVPPSPPPAEEYWSQSYGISGEAVMGVFQDPGQGIAAAADLGVNAGSEARGSILYTLATVGSFGVDGGGVGKIVFTKAFNAGSSWQLSLGLVYGDATVGARYNGDGDHLLLMGNFTSNLVFKLVAYDEITDNSHGAVIAARRWILWYGPTATNICADALILTNVLNADVYSFESAFPGQITSMAIAGEVLSLSPPGGFDFYHDGGVKVGDSASGPSAFVSVIW